MSRSIASIPTVVRLVQRRATLAALLAEDADDCRLLAWQFLPMIEEIQRQFGPISVDEEEDLSQIVWRRFDQIVEARDQPSDAG